MSNLPIAPWLIKDLKFADLLPAKNVMFFGLLRDSYNGKEFANDLGAVFSNPVSYVAIFSIAFINLFDTTATYLSVNDKVKVMDEDGKFISYRRTALADTIGTVIVGPMGTTTVEPLAETNVGAAAGAKTGLAAIVIAFMFLLSAFIYPIFSVFTANTVTAPAVVGIGLVILSSSVPQLNLKKADVFIVGVIAILMSVLTYSISNGIGFGLIAYCVIKIVEGKYKEIGVPIYIITCLFIIAFTAETLMKVMTK